MAIYLDYNATAPMRQEAFAATCELLQKPLNASSVHSNGRAAKAILEKSRTKIADIIGCFPAELVLTGCGTEANNMVLNGVGDTAIAVCATEHSSVLKVASGAHLIPVNEHGIINMQALEEWLREVDSPALVAVMLANNETGVVQNVRDVAQLVHQYGGLVHCDAVQAFGKIAVDCTMLQVDFLSLSAHKIGGGLGAGALFIADKRILAPLIIGGGQEQGRRAGTENIAAISAFATAAEEAMDMGWTKRLRGWLDEMEQQCQAMFASEKIILGAGASRLPNTSCLRMPNVGSQTQLIHFDMAGIEVSAGSACSSGRVTRSHVVQAMLGAGAGDDVIRISGGWNTTEEEIKSFTASWQKLARRLTDKRNSY
jgi:cysteine desulfurase